MPRDAELLQIEEKKDELKTGQLTESEAQETALQSVTTQQTTQTAQTAQGTVTLITEQIPASDFGTAAIQKPVGPAIEFTAKSGVAKSEDSSRMVLIRNSVAAYFAELDAYDRADVKSKERIEAAEKLMRDAEAIISSCWWYCFFRHPFSFRGIQRKKEVKALRAKVEERLADLREEVDALKLINKKKYDPSDTRTVKVSSKGILSFGSLNIHYDQSDIKRVEKKNELRFMQMQDSIRFRKSRKEIRTILADISAYSEIRLTAMHISAAISQGQKKKAMARAVKFRQENSLFVKIVGDIEKTLKKSDLSTEEREMLTKYKTFFENTFRGNLKPKEEKNAIVLDYTDKIKEGDTSFVNSTNENKKIEARKRENPLFVHEPCVQDVLQGDLGDCYFVAVLAGLVAKDPNAIRDMMYDEGFNVTVRFYERDKKDPQKMRPVLVRIPKIAPDAGTRYTLWVKYFEVAYAIFKRHQYETDDNVYKKRKKYDLKSPVDLAILNEGGNPEMGSLALAGKPSETVHIEKSLFTKIGLNGIKAGPVAMATFEKTDAGKAMAMMNLMLAAKADEKKLCGKAYSRDGYRKQEADPEQAEKYEKIADMEANRIKIGLNREFYVCEDPMEEKFVVCYKEITEQLDAIDQAWEEAHPEIVEKKARWNVIVFEQLPKLKYDMEKLSVDDPEHKRLEDQIARLENEKNALGQYLTKNDLNGFSGRTRKGMPGPKLHMYEKHRLSRVEALQDDSDCLVDWLCKNKKIGGYSKTPQQYIEKTEPVIAALTALTYEEAEKVVKTFLHPIYTLYDPENPERWKKAFELVKKHAIKTLQLSVEKVKEANVEYNTKMFTGEYTPQMISYYEDIKKGLDAGKKIFAGSERKDTGSDGTADTGEVMDEGVADGHAYAVLDCGEYDYNGKKIRMLKLRNPWGKYVPRYRVNEKGQVEAEQNNGKTNGVFWMELSHFTREFYTYDMF